MITPYNLVNHELIGLGVKVEHSTNSSLVGIEGRVVDENSTPSSWRLSRGEEGCPRTCALSCSSLIQG